MGAWCFPPGQTDSPWYVMREQQGKKKSHCLSSSVVRAARPVSFFARAFSSFLPTLALPTCLPACLRAGGGPLVLPIGYDISEFRHFEAVATASSSSSSHAAEEVGSSSKKKKSP